MAREHDKIELISVFAPDDDVAWDSAEPPPGPLGNKPAPQPSRRAPLLAGVVAVALMAAGAIAFSNDSKSDSAPTTVLEIATTERPLLDPQTSDSGHYLLDAPDLTPYAADVVTPPPSDQEFHVYTDGTAVGPIVTFELHTHPYTPYGIVGATRDLVDGIELVRTQVSCPTLATQSSARCEAVTAEVAIDEQSSVTVRATRLSDADIVRIVRGLRVIDGELAEDSDLLESLQLGQTFAGPSRDSLIFGIVTSAVRYISPDGGIVTLRAGLGRPDNRLASFLYLVNGAQRAADNRAYGYLDNGDSIVVWEDKGVLLSLVAAGDASHWLDVSQHVRPVAGTEWSDMLYGLRPDLRLGDFATLGSGEASNSELWRAGPQLTERSGRQDFLWWWTVPGRDDATASTPGSSTIGSRPNVDTLVVPGATFVFVTQPKAGGMVTVRAADGTAYTAELTQPFEQTAVYMAVVRIEQPGPVTVEVDGVEVAQ